MYVRHREMIERDRTQHKSSDILTNVPGQNDTAQVAGHALVFQSGPHGVRPLAEELLQSPSGGSTSEDPFSAFAEFLPKTQLKIVQKALSGDSCCIFSDAVNELVGIGGPDSVKALVCILSQAVTDDGALANLSMRGRHVTVYTLSRALLKTADATRLSSLEGVEPKQKLSRYEKQQVWQLIRSLAKGDHGDAETAMGVRGLLFERFAEIPIIGKVLDFALRASILFDGAPSGGPPRLLFVLYDLPWALRSKLPFASLDTRANNLAEILYRGKAPKH